MSRVRWQIDSRYNMNGATKAAIFYDETEAEKYRVDWQEALRPYEDRINAEGGILKAYIVNGGFNLSIKLEGITEELRRVLREAGLKL